METTIESYTAVVSNQDQALCHLFFHCCLEDERFTEQEMVRLSAMLVELGIQPRVNVKAELLSYRHYRSYITDESSYLRFLIGVIRPVHELALYSYCLELCISDPSLDPREETLLTRIAEILEIASEDTVIITRLVAQRKSVELQKIF